MEDTWEDVFNEVNANPAYKDDRDWVICGLEGLRKIFGSGPFKVSFRKNSHLMMLILFPYPVVRRHISTVGHILESLSSRNDFNIVRHRLLAGDEFDSVLEECYIGFALDQVNIENEFLSPKKQSKQADLRACYGDAESRIEVYRMKKPAKAQITEKYLGLILWELTKAKVIYAGRIEGPLAEVHWKEIQAGIRDALKEAEGGRGVIEVGDPKARFLVGSPDERAQLEVWKTKYGIPQHHDIIGPPLPKEDGRRICHAIRTKQNQIPEIFRV